MTDRPDVPDSAVVLALSRAEFGVDSVLDAVLVWRISKLFGGLGEVFENRQRGSIAARLVGKLPAIGEVGGFFDERKGIRRAAYAAVDLLTTDTYRT